jgi:hypothetical protein
MKCLSIIVLLWLGWMISACTNSRVSSYARYNSLSENWMQTLSNDSLGISMEFNFSHRIKDPQVVAKIRYPREHKKIIRQLGLKSKVELLFYSCPTRLFNGYYTRYGYLIRQGTVGSSTANQLVRGSKSFSIINILPVNNAHLLLISTVRVDKGHPMATDTSKLVADTKMEMESYLQGKEYREKSNRRKKLVNDINQYMADSSYIQPIHSLAALDSVEWETAAMASLYFQTYLTRLSFLDALVEMKRVFALYRPYLHVNKVRGNDPVIVVDTGVNAFSYLADQAKKQKMMMFNESHYDFRHRYFLYLLLDQLYSNGYRHLCLETLSHGATISTYGFPLQSDGFYTSEPFMAMLIRKAIGLGFHIHAYEDTTSNSAAYRSGVHQREYNQGLNLYNLYKSDTAGKWLVLAGYDHINKRFFSTGEYSASQYFEKLSGIAPLRVNQSYFSDIYSVVDGIQYCKSGYYLLDKKSDIYKDGQADLYLVNNIGWNPIEKPVAGIRNDFKPVSFVLNEGNQESAYVMVYGLEEYNSFGPKAIPCYIKKINGVEHLLLWLPPGNYKVVYTNDSGNAIATLR